MEGVEGEVVVGKDEVSEGYEYRETMSMGDVSFQGGDINADKQDIGVKGGGEGVEDGEEMVRIFNV